MTPAWSPFAVFLGVLSYAVPAAAEAFLTLAVGAADAGALPRISAPVRIAWEAGARDRPGRAADYLGCTVAVLDGERPATEASLRFVAGVSELEDRGELQFVSPHGGRQPRLASVRLACGGVHNGKGDRFALFDVPPNAHVVIGGGGKTRADAAAALERYRQRGLPRHGDYPRLADSTYVAGLKPGFHVVVVGIPTELEVAQGLVAFIEACGAQAYAKPVWVPEPEALRLVRFEQLAAAEDGGGPIAAQLATLVQSGRTPGVETTRGDARPSANGAVALAFVADPRLDDRAVVGLEVVDYECDVVAIPDALGSRWVHALGRRSVLCRMVGD